MDLASIHRRRNLNVCYVTDSGQSESYRSVVPAMALARRGIYASVIPFQEMVRYPTSQWNVFVFRGSIGEPQSLDAVEKILHARNATMVFDVDDDPAAHYLSNRFDPIYLGRKCDICTISTPALKTKVPNPVVLPNALDLNLWAYGPKRETEGHELTVGLVGGSTHMEDWRQVEPLLRKLSGKMRIVVGGYFPGYLRGLDVEFIPWKPYEEYPDTIREIDILLCPVNDDEFNKFKSGIKAVEGMSQGCTVIASDHPIYRRVVNHRHNGLLVKTSWDEALEEAMDPRLREKLSRNGRKWVETHRDIDALIPEYIKAYAEARMVVQ